jgi:hypothetical protein
MHEQSLPGIYAGLATLEVPEEPVDFGGGVTLSRTFARFSTSFNFINTGDTSVPNWKPSEPGELPPLPPPAMWHVRASQLDITSQLFVPESPQVNSAEAFQVARLLTSTLRLYADPAVSLVAISTHPYDSLINRRLEGCKLAPVEVLPRHFPLGLVTTGCNVEGIRWVARHWRTVLRLYQSHAEFRLAVDALDHGQFEPNPSLSLVALWGAIEALFSPSTTELKFRVSSLVAAFLEAPGIARLTRQRRVAALYDQRSAAAHGKPKHTPDHLLDTFELVRSILIKITELGEVPTKAQLEERMFGASSSGPTG